jgi:hypothetical protein
MNIRLMLACIALILAHTTSGQQRKTILSMNGDDFYINGKPTYAGVTWQGVDMSGLLMNSRMVQGIFDDLNPDTRGLFNYPDTKTWDADRNTNEFVAAMESWKRHGLLAFTLNLQGGSPTGYGNKAWINSAFDSTGNLRKAYMRRLDKILSKADALGMVVILGYFYFGQDQHLKDEKAVLAAVDNATAWILRKRYRNVMVEVNNECNISYDHDILKPERVHELINRVKSKTRNRYRLLVSTSYGGNFIPLPNVVAASDFLLLHGNGVSKPERITEMVARTRQVAGYKPMPILFNEDDHYDFDKPVNNMVNAVKANASWGFFDYRRNNESFNEGYQSVPVNWQISSERKRGFFELLKKVTGVNVNGEW